MSIYKLLKGIVVFDLFNSKKTFLTVPKLNLFASIILDIKTPCQKKVKRIQQIIKAKKTTIETHCMIDFWHFGSVYIYYFGPSNHYVLKFQNNMFDKSWKYEIPNAKVFFIFDHIWQKNNLIYRPGKLFYVWMRCDFMDWRYGAKKNYCIIFTRKM